MHIFFRQDAIAGKGSLALGGGEPDQDQGTLRRFARGRPRLVPTEDEEEDEDSIGYEDDFSIGIDLPLQLDVTSGLYTLYRVNQEGCYRPKRRNCSGTVQGL